MFRLLVLLAACSTEPPILVDAAPDSAPDACVREPSGGCCALLPDEAAVLACVSPGPGLCVEIVCWQSDCTLARVSFCSP